MKKCTLQAGFGMRSEELSNGDCTYSFGTSSVVYERLLEALGGKGTGTTATMPVGVLRLH